MIRRAIDEPVRRRRGAHARKHRLDQGRNDHILAQQGVHRISIALGHSRNEFVRRPYHLRVGAFRIDR